MEQGRPVRVLTKGDLTLSGKTGGWALVKYDRKLKETIYYHKRPSEINAVSLCIMNEIKTALFFR